MGGGHSFSQEGRVARLDIENISRASGHLAWLDAPSLFSRRHSGAEQSRP